MKNDNTFDNMVIYTEPFDDDFSGKYSLGDKIQFAQQFVSDGKDIVKNIENIYSMRERTKQIEAMTNVQLSNIIAKYQTCHEFITKTFSERSDALQKNYAVLDKAVQANDRAMIIASLQSISGIVTTSPLKDLKYLAENFDDSIDHYLDF